MKKILTLLMIVYIVTLYISQNKKIDYFNNYKHINFLEKNLCLTTKIQNKILDCTEQIFYENIKDYVLFFNNNYNYEFQERKIQYLNNDYEKFFTNYKKALSLCTQKCISTDGSLNY